MINSEWFLLWIKIICKIAPTKLTNRTITINNFSRTSLQTDWRWLLANWCQIIWFDWFSLFIPYSDFPPIHMQFTHAVMNDVWYYHNCTYARLILWLFYSFTLSLSLGYKNCFSLPNNTHDISKVYIRNNNKEIFVIVSDIHSNRWSVTTHIYWLYNKHHDVS